MEFLDECAGTFFSQADNEDISDFAVPGIGGFRGIWRLSWTNLFFILRFRMDNNFL
jgi:hypothetical protein